MESSYLLERRMRMLGILPEKKEGKGIAVFSEKRKKANKVYREIVKEILSKDKRCKIKAPGCTGTAQGLHHIIKRSPKNLTDKENLIPACNHCNSYLESHDAWGREQGFVKSKFKNN